MARTRVEKRQSLKVVDRKKNVWKQAVGDTHDQRHYGKSEL